MTQQEVLNLFQYRDGNLYNKVDRANGKVKTGAIAGYLNNTGYMRLELGGRKYLVHRLIFLLHHGYMPKRLDHKDRNPLNNRIENLREATHFQNMANATIPVTNKSGFKGVCWHKRTKKWRSQISANNHKIYLGDFDTPELAHESYKKAAAFYFKEFANA